MNRFSRASRCPSRNPVRTPPSMDSVYSGSLVVQGFGSARITATGAHTEIGKIGGVLKTLAARDDRAVR